MVKTFVVICEKNVEKYFLSVVHRSDRDFPGLTAEPPTIIRAPTAPSERLFIQAEMLKP
jgi:hypothetical protein